MKLRYAISILVFASILFITGMTSGTDVDDSNYRKLTAAEENVIVHGGTEAPFSGIYVDTFENGLYSCRRCGSILYESDSKFRAHCGWPAFDNEIEGAVERRTDSDGRRTEILCATCGGHLGHVFTGEGYTETDTRHCVNSLSMDFIPAERIETAYFAGGCFWGIESSFDHTPGVLQATSGYMGGNVENPEYQSVCSGATGHAETVRVLFDNSVVSYRELAMIFFEIHDPTQFNYQGVDYGTQYRSAVFCTTPEQLNVIHELVSILEENGLAVVTDIEESGVFWEAESYHQDYFDVNSIDASCHIRINRFD